MCFILYPIVFIIIIIVSIESNSDYNNIYATLNINNNNQNSKVLANISNFNEFINLSSNGTNYNISIFGKVDTSFNISKDNYWVATGNWSLKLINSIPIFDLNMTWYNSKQDIYRIYHIYNFKPKYTLIGSLSNNLVITNGTSYISLNDQIELPVPITIQIQNNKTMMLYYNDITFNRHFGKQPLHGIATTINFNKNLSMDKILPTVDNNNNQRSYEILQQNNLSKKNISLPINNGNTDKYSIKSQSRNNSTTTMTTTLNSITIPKNAAFIGNPSYLPSVIEINQGENIKVINNDNNYHTVTSIDRESTTSLQLGRFFDSDIIYPQKTIIIYTAKLKPGEYPFECSIHPFMKGMLIIK